MAAWGQSPPTEAALSHPSRIAAAAVVAVVAVAAGPGGRLLLRRIVGEHFGQLQILNGAPLEARRVGGVSRCGEPSKIAAWLVARNNCRSALSMFPMFAPPDVARIPFLANGQEHVWSKQDGAVGRICRSAFALAPYELERDIARSRKSRSGW